MIVITVKTPYDNDLSLEWDNMRVKAKGGREALVYWERLKNSGLHGMYGHVLVLENCSFRDLVNALSESLDPGEFSYGEDGKEQIRREVKEERENPIPKDSLS
jgi:hypothetical protein